MSVRRVVLVLLLFFSLQWARSQDILQIKMDGSEMGKTLPAVLEEISTRHQARFFFLPEWVANMTFQQGYQGQTLGDALNSLFLGTDLNFFAMYPDAVVIVKDPTQAISRQSAIETAVRQQRKIDRVSFGEPGKLVKGQRVVIRGTVVDAKTKEPMPGANILVNDTQAGTSTDESGRYQLTLDPGLHVLNFSYVDYDSKVLDVTLYEDGEINLEMEKVPVLLEEVVIQAQSTQELATSRIGQTQFTMREVKRAPAFLGEVDLIKQVQTLPGVTTVGEAATGFNVRGGSVDQNLILYDGLPVFNSAHVFGFLSAFNSEAIRDVSFYRGGIPAEYGGRTSSVLDIQSRDGDYEKWNYKAGIGMITSNFMANGPLVKDKTSLAASFRSTYSNWLVRSIKTDYADLRKSSVGFYDGTLKLAHRFDTKTKLAFTGYSSKDGFKLLGDSVYQWKNLQGSLRLDHEYSQRLSFDLVVGRSEYGYSVENQDVRTASILSYHISTTAIKAAAHYQQGKHKYNMGWQLLHYRFNPGTLKPNSPESNAKALSLDKQYSIENAFFASDEWSWREDVLVEGGLRIPTFLSFGPAALNRYEAEKPREITTVTDTITFKRFQPIKAFAGVEPRLSVRWTLNATSSVKFGYNRMYQYLHLITNSTAVTPVDIWQPSGYYFKPQRADQISIGYFKDFEAKKYGTSAEVFYKKMKNILDFKDGAQLILNRHLETDLLQGKGHSYGLETFVSKNTGRLTGSLNYTYSRTFRQIAGPTSLESINNGKKYPANFDQPHILNLSWKYNLSRRHFFTGNFTYHTGRPVTIPLSAFVLENSTVAYFSSRNQYRIPDYHRMDLAFVFEGNHRRQRHVKGTWVFSVYNVYGRKNPYTVFFRSTGNGVPKPYQLSIIGTVFPSISYNMTFQ